MNLIIGICLLIGIVCLLYYGIITIYAGSGTAFAWFWLCAGVGLIISAFVIRYMINNDIKILNLWKYLIIAIFSIGVCIFFILEGTIIYYAGSTPEKNADYMIVLGAQVKGTRVSKTLKKRLDTAVLYLADNPETLVIVSGGQGPGEEISEAEAMKRYLVSEGIMQNRIVKEDSSTNTNENVCYSKRLIESSNSSVAIVTNGFHVFRAISIAKKQGFTDVQGLAAPSEWILIPNYYVREVAGVIKDFLVHNI